jgi:hypothetical protein
MIGGLITTEDQRKVIIQHIADVIGNKDILTVVIVIGECMNYIEFDLNQVSPITGFREQNPNASFEDFYQHLIAYAKELGEHPNNWKIPPLAIGDI